MGKSIHRLSEDKRYCMRYNYDIYEWLVNQLGLGSYVYSSTDMDNGNMIIIVDEQVVKKMKESLEEMETEDEGFKEFYEQAKEDLEKEENEEENGYPTVYYAVW